MYCGSPSLWNFRAGDIKRALLINFLESDEKMTESLEETLYNCLQVIANIRMIDDSSDLKQWNLEGYHCKSNI